MAEGNGPSPDQMGLSPKDLGIKPEVNKQPASTPQFIKQFSKEHSQVERDEMAQKIRATRSGFFGQRSQLEGSRDQIAEKKTITDQELLVNLEKVAKLEQTASVLSENWFVKSLNFFRLSKINSLQGRTQGVVDALRATHGDLLLEESSVKDRLDKPAELDQARQMLAKFYDDQKLKWENTPYNKEDIKRYFTEQNLASLSMEDYILLLKRFPSEMVTHVTRQGIRDHVAEGMHTAGKGQFENGFIKILRDGRIRSSLGAFLKNGVSKEAILNLFSSIESRIGNHLDAKSTILKLMGKVNQGIGQYYDHNAVHVAAQEVGDRFYGAEKGNEIFFAFPSAHIASEHYFAGKLNNQDFKNANDRNDVFVWSEEENKGLSLNAGVVFIPSDAHVDRVSGSKYALDKDGKPLERQDLVSNIQKMVTSDRFSGIYDQYKQYLGERDPAEQLNIKAQIQEKLSGEFGISDANLQEIILKEGVEAFEQAKDPNHYVYQTDFYKSIDENVLEKSKDILMKAGLLFQLSRDTVTSQQYWENYFVQNPGLKPKRMVFYEGGDPTLALLKWKESNGLVKTSSDFDFGFSEREVKNFWRDKANLEQANQGFDRFRSLAEEAFVDYFSQEEFDMK